MKVHVGCRIVQNSDGNDHSIPIAVGLTKDAVILKLFEFEKQDLLEAANYLKKYDGYMLVIAKDKEDRANAMTVENFIKFYLEDYEIIEMETD